MFYEAEVRITRSCPHVLFDDIMALNRLLDDRRAARASRRQAADVVNAAERIVQCTE